jgi:hypothetical protein
VTAAFGELRAQQREALWMHVVEELPYPEVSTALGLSEPAARARVSRGLRALRRATAEHRKEQVVSTNRGRGFEGLPILAELRERLNEHYRASAPALREHPRLVCSRRWRPAHSVAQAILASSPRRGASRWWCSTLVVDDGGLGGAPWVVAFDARHVAA